MAIDYTFYQRYNGMATTNNREDTIKDLQANTQAMFENDYISGFELMIGTDYYNQRATVNGEREIECIFKYQKMKEAVFNSLALKISVRPNELKTGDLLTMKFEFDKDMEERTYIVRDMPNKKRGYDEHFILLCQYTFKLKHNGKIINIPTFVDDNKTMLRDSSIGAIENQDVSSSWIYVQKNAINRKLGSNIKRLIIDGEAYKIIGVNHLTSTSGLIMIAIKNDEVHPMDDLINGIAYNGEDSTEEPSPTLEIVGEKDLYFDTDCEYTIDNTTTYPTIWVCTEPFVKFRLVDGNKCIIYVEYDRALTNKTFELKCTVDIATYTKTIKLIN